MSHVQNFLVPATFFSLLWNVIGIAATTALSGEHFKFEDVTSVTVGEEDVRSHSGHDGPGPAVAKNLWRHTAVTMVKARMGEWERQGEEMDRGYPLKNKT